jgi:hypothetical protein
MSSNAITLRIGAATFVTACGLLYFVTLFHPCSMHNRLDRYLYHSISTDRSGLAKLYDAIRHPVATDAYTDVHGNVFEIQEDGPHWTKPLKHNVLVVDVDTRAPDDTNELWNNGSMSWEG